MPIRKSQLIDENTGQVMAEKSGLFETFHPEKGYLFRNNAKYVKFYQEIRFRTLSRTRVTKPTMHHLAEAFVQEYEKNAVYGTRNMFRIGIRHAADCSMCERRFKEFLDRK
jgi:hypothetical protein